MQSDYVQSGCDQKYSFQFGGMGESNLWEQFDDSLADADEPVLEFGNFYKDILKLQQIHELTLNIALPQRLIFINAMNSVTRWLEYFFQSLAIYIDGNSPNSKNILSK